MIELTTGVVFLMSSLYGSGNGDNHTNRINAVIPASIEATTTIDRSFPNSNPVSMEAYLRTRLTNEPILVDIARCESNFHQFDTNGDVVRGIINKGDVGVMQINEKYHADMAKKLGMDLYTLDGNIEYAKHLYHEQGVEPWSASSKCWSQGDLAKK